MRLTVSKGPEPVTITSVVGTTLEDATGQLEPDNLKLAPTEVFSDTVAAGLIIDQSPVAGAEGHRGDTIAVNVSKGPEMLALPSTYGQNVKTAEAALQARRVHREGRAPAGHLAAQHRLLAEARGRRGQDGPPGQHHRHQRLLTAPPPRPRERTRAAAGAVGQDARSSSTTWNAISSDCWWFRRGSTSVS